MDGEVMSGKDKRGYRRPLGLEWATRRINGAEVGLKAHIMFRWLGVDVLVTDSGVDAKPQIRKSGIVNKELGPLLVHA